MSVYFCSVLHATKSLVSAAAILALGWISPWFTDREIVSPACTCSPALTCSGDASSHGGLGLSSFALYSAGKWKCSHSVSRKCSCVRALTVESGQVDSVTIAVPRTASRRRYGLTVSLLHCAASATTDSMPVTSVAESIGARPRHRGTGQSGDLVAGSSGSQSYGIPEPPTKKETHRWSRGIGG